MQWGLMWCVLGAAVGCGSVGCGGAKTGSAAPTGTQAAASEPTVSNVVRTRLPKDTPCAAGDACGFFLQVISPGAEPAQLADRAHRIVRGHCGGAIIVYRDKRGVMGAGPVFATADEKQACRDALGRTADGDDYPTAAVWRKAE